MAEDNVVGLHVQIPRELHTAVKTLAAEEKTKVKTLVINALHKLIEDYNANSK